MLGVLGDLVQDVVVWQHEATRTATDTSSDIRVQRGGQGANVATFAAPRYPTRFIGCVGDDPAGRALVEEMRLTGVDVRTQVRGTTGVIVVLVDPDGERNMYPSRGANALLEAVDDAWLADLEWLHVPGYVFAGGSTRAAALDAIARVRAHGCEVSIDTSSVGLISSLGVDAFLDLLERIEPDVVSANRDEATLLGLADGATAGPNLPRLGAGVLLARAGAAATNVYEAGRLLATVEVPPQTEVRDLTGAGDAFMAGYLAHRLRNGWDVPGNIEAGHALAARVLHHPGAREG